MNVEEFPEDSDTSDEEYIPGAKPEEVVSEVDSDGEPEDPLSDSEASPKKKRRKTKKGARSKKLKKESTNSGDEEIEESQQKNELTEEEKKKQADDLWADFLQDTGFKSKTAISKPNDTTTSKEKTLTKSETTSKSQTNKVESDKVKITEIFEFAGEEVKVEKEVSKDSVEARLLGSSSSSDTNKVRKKGSLSGIGSVLSQLGKKKKISTLEKTKLDWDRFKKDENLEEELNNHNKGKDGYLDRQDFLQRADLRRFEIEKEIRTVERNKRMNLGEPF
ncbi:craniofacial development protein 1 [Harmonia axyridis]|uniref:craniofacial development protein 1 n=1 Tax=Harmonia axyridis TaxID=115357 RepID=UPI001E275840|nr:craniofacial development protein 1 [Harmonia axyridis]